MHCLALLLAAVAWKYPDRSLRFRVEVDARANMPISVPVQAEPNSVVVTGEDGQVPTGIDGSAGWVARRAGRQAWYVYYNPPGNAPIPFRDCREPIGLGDNFFYNRPEGFDYLGVGMKNDQVFAVDWDGDGRTDLLQRNLYSAAFGEPWWGLYFWRNIGTNRNPRFDRYIRLKADGQAIQDYYASYEVIDWDRDGRPDILCGVGAKKFRNTLKVYRNTGARDAEGLPLLVTGPTLEWHGGGELTFGMRLLPWSAPGVLDLFTLRLKVQYFPTQEMNSTWYRHARTAEGFGPPEPLAIGGKTVYDEWPNDLYDINGDGKPDLIGSTRGLGTYPLRTCVVTWENTGSRQRPAFDKAPYCLLDTSPEGFAVPVAADTPAFHGLLVSYMGSWLRYIERMPAGLADRGPLTARGLPCSSGGYSSMEVADWEGDGDLDLIAGNEVGFVQLIENVSRVGRTMFRTARPIPLTDGKPMYAARWQFIKDDDPERPFGQSKPTYVDWDGDGDLDMLVGNNSNRIAYFENVGTRRQPRFAPLRRLEHDGGDRFSFRARPAAVDWNGDGLMDLVAGSTAGVDRNNGPDIAVCLYTRYRDAKGALRLGPGKPFLLAGGSQLRTPIPYRHGYEAADWDGDGDFDLLANEDHQLVLYTNTGSNANPVFARSLLKLYGEPIAVSFHETSLKAVDWDRSGKLDLITGGESGWAYFFRRDALDASQKPLIERGPVEEK